MSLLILLIQAAGFHFFGQQVSLPAVLDNWTSGSSKVIQAESDWAAGEILSSDTLFPGFPDWQKVLFAVQAGKALFPETGNEQARLIGSLWKKSGFRVQIAQLETGRILPLIQIRQTLFGIPYFRLNGEKYYDYLGISVQDSAGKKSRITWDERDEPDTEATKPVNLTLDVLPAAGSEYTEKKLTWTFKDTLYQFTIRVNRHLAAWYQTLPVLAFQEALSYRFSAELQRDLVLPLSARMTYLGLTDQEKAECLRQMLLQCFPYVDDQELFGKEKIQYPEEILMSAGCDCEDRSLFLFKLIEKCTRLKPVLADFPGHVSLLISAPDTWSGEFYLYSGRRFVYCDPTYFNAPFGDIPEEIRNQTPDVIDYPNE